MILSLLFTVPLLAAMACLLRPESDDEDPVNTETLKFSSYVKEPEFHIIGNMIFRCPGSRYCKFTGFH